MARWGWRITLLCTLNLHPPPAYFQGLRRRGQPAQVGLGLFGVEAPALHSQMWSKPSLLPSSVEEVWGQRRVRGVRLNAHVGFKPGVGVKNVYEEHSVANIEIIEISRTLANDLSVKRLKVKACHSS